MPAPDPGTYQFQWFLNCHVLYTAPVVAFKMQTPQPCHWEVSTFQGPLKLVLLRATLLNQVRSWLPPQPPWDRQSWEVSGLASAGLAAKVAHEVYNHKWAFCSPVRNLPGAFSWFRLLGIPGPLRAEAPFPSRMACTTATGSGGGAVTKSHSFGARASPASLPPGLAGSSLSSARPFSLHQKAFQPDPGADLSPLSPQPSGPGPPPTASPEGSPSPSYLLPPLEGSLVPSGEGESSPGGRRWGPGPGEGC